MGFERAPFDLEIRQKPIRYQYVLCSHIIIWVTRLR